MSGTENDTIYIQGFSYKRNDHLIFLRGRKQDYALLTEDGKGQMSSFGKWNMKSRIMRIPPKTVCRLKYEFKSI